MNGAWKKIGLKIRTSVANLKRSLGTLVLSLTMILAIATAYLVVADTRGFLASGQLRPHRHLRAMLFGRPFEVPNADSISDWMTFEYLNRVFDLPPEYLKNTLGITDGRYPRISIRRYAILNGLAVPDAVSRVKSAIKNRPAPARSKP